MVRLVRRKLQRWLIASALLLSPTAAHANGRFPFAAQLVVDPLDASHIVVRTTFGPLQSTDGGHTWQWICERSVGYTGIFDPSLAIAEGGVLFGLSDALSRSEDRGCSFVHVPGDIDGRYLVDLAVDRTDPRHVVAITTPTVLGDPGAASYFFDSRDGGRFFLRFGDALPADVVPETVELAPSRPGRVYVSGKGPSSTGVMLRSDDGGATWERTDFSLGGAKAPYIATVDPRDEARVFVRLDQEPADRLLVSTDAGRTFVDVFQREGKLYGFALSPDGTKVAVGGPTDGVFIADAHDLVFIKASDIEARCLTWSTAGLWACVDETPTTFSVGLSTDEGKTFVPRYRLRDVTPLVCARGTTTGDRCAEDWPAVQTTLGIDDAGAGAKDASIGVDADVGIDASRDDADASALPVASSNDGCSCEVPGPASDRSAGWLSLGVALLLVSRLARRSQPADS
jgi:photosystem II stability/assembly factor-like uncharacterized protein